jgi:peptidoglycan LD-endopeptidase CwlK
MDKLTGVHADLAAVVRKALTISDVKFIVTEGVRSKERQAQLIAAGASRTMQSKHLTGEAVDLAAVVDGEVRWDWPLYHNIAKAMKEAARELGIKITWGGDWRTFKDGPHFQLG